MPLDMDLATEEFGDDALIPSAPLATVVRERRLRVWAPISYPAATSCMCFAVLHHANEATISSV